MSSQHDAMLAAARALAPRIRAAHAEIDAGRKLPAALLAKMVQAGLFRLQTPSEIGGCELTWTEFMDVVEEVARADGSAAWIVAVGNSGLLWGALRRPTAEAIFAPGPDVLSASSFNPRGGRAVPRDGGYQVSGSWQFLSGSHHAAWFILGCLLSDGRDFVRGPTGAVEVRRLLVPAADVGIHDTWSVIGLKGTASHDISVKSAFVPLSHVLSDSGVDRPAGPQWAFPPDSGLGLAFVSVGLGLARCAIDAVTELAGAKKPVGSPNLLRERPSVQRDIARAEIKLRAARTLLHSLVNAMWEAAGSGTPVSLEERALLRASVVNAAEVSAEVVELMYATAGATALFESFPLERCLRDVRAVTQQIMLSPQFWEVSGRVLLGLEPGLLPF